MNIANECYDVHAHKKPVHSFESLDDFLNMEIVGNGIYHLHLSGDLFLDIYIQGFEYFDPQNGKNTWLVNHSGAICDRTGKKAPFFSGVGLAETLKMPLIAIADPSLALDADIPIGWYAGNEVQPNLHHLIARILNALVERYGIHLLLFGGSGGGFASLAVAEHLKREATVFVWNPQTSIENYNIEFVEHYLRKAFPSFYNRIETFDRDKAVEGMEYFGVNHRLSKLPAHIKMLYIQNIEDWHTRRHAGPYMELYDLLPYGQSTFIDTSGSQVFFFGNWGERHAVPPYKMIKMIVEHLALHQNPILSAWMIDRGIENVFSKPFPLLCWKAEQNKRVLQLQVSRDGSKVFAECKIGGLYAADPMLQYAFYFYENDTKVKQIGYGKENTILFEIEPLNKDAEISVAVFVKDCFGGMRRKRVQISNFK